MSVSIDELRSLANDAVALGADRPRGVRASDVLPHLDSEDRNVRVAALRVLAWCEGTEAVEGILRGLDDPVKRVREVAAKSTPRFLDDERVVARLSRAITDDETGSARPAVEILGGMFSSPYGLSNHEVIAVAALGAAADRPRYRQAALLALLRARALTPEIADLLRAFVRDGSKDEAVFATRRLDGFRVERMELLSPEEKRASDRAFGDVWYWVRAEA